MNIDKRHAIAMSVPVMVTGIPFGTIEATDQSVPVEPDEDSYDPQATDPVFERVHVEKPLRSGHIALQLHERRDGDYVPIDPRLEVISRENTDEVESLMYIPSDEPERPKVMENPITQGRLRPIQDVLPHQESLTDGVARIADTALQAVIGDNDIVVATELDAIPQNNTTRVDQIDSNMTPAERMSTENANSKISIMGVEVGVPVGGGISIEVNSDKSFTVRHKKEVVEVESASTDDSNEALLVGKATKPHVNQETIAPDNSLNALTKEVERTAKPAGNGLYFMPDPTIENGKVTYLFDKDTCNSERRGYPEHIAAVVAITDKYNELVSTEKYAKYKDTILDIGDFMSHVHIEHDGDNPAVDVRSRTVSSPSGKFDGPAFVPNSSNYDVDLTVELFEYMQSLEYNGKPILKYIIVKDTNGLSAKTAHLKRYYNDRNLLIFKDDHPEHAHFAFTLYGESNNIEPESDFGGPCPISGADFTEAREVTEVSEVVGDHSNGKSGEIKSGNESEGGASIHGMTTFEDPDTFNEDPILVDDPELIEFLRTEAAEEESSQHSEDSTVNTSTDEGSIYTIAGTIPNNSRVDTQVVRIENVNPGSELARVVNAGTLTDGKRDAAEIVDDLSLHAQKLLNGIDAYAPLSPYDAANLRQENQDYTPYVQELQTVDKRLTEREVLTRALVAHEIVFGDRYGTEYQEDKIKSDVERITAFSGRESQRYPGAVGDFKTEGENSGSGGLLQILNWDVQIDTTAYEGVRDFDANLDPIQNLIHAFQMVDSNRANGRSSFADWESDWKSDEGRKRDMEIYEENLFRIRTEGIYDTISNPGAHV